MDRRAESDDAVAKARPGDTSVARSLRRSADVSPLCPLLPGNLRLSVSKMAPWEGQVLGPAPLLSLKEITGGTDVAPGVE